ncbi:MULTISPECIES: hypothetical protein [Pseudomonas]|uniref:hypothetical protein n=1 Tax=unclassified Pseudomonas TaxID=196821 RepID=UPI002119A589|nr:MULTISPECIES: hypothetical protein [unclassified Pseudomonas]
MFSTFGGMRFFATIACRHQAKEADQEHRTDQGRLSFHGSTLQKMDKEISVVRLNAAFRQQSSHRRIGLLFDAQVIAGGFQ